MLKESVGFVDTEELEDLERQTKFYLSDIYSLVLSVDGVRNIGNLHLKGGNAVKINAPAIFGQKVFVSQKILSSPLNWTILASTCATMQA